MSQAMLHFDNMEDVRERLEDAVTQSSVETSYDGEDCFITVTQKNYETGNKSEWSFCVDFDTQKVIMLEPMEDTEGFSNDNEVFEIIKNFLNGGSSREKRMNRPDYDSGEPIKVTGKGNKIGNSKKPIKSDYSDEEYWYPEETGQYVVQIENRKYEDSYYTYLTEKGNWLGKKQDAKIFTDINEAEYEKNDLQKYFYSEGMGASYWVSVKELDKINSSKSIKSSYTSWDDFYDKGCKLGLQTYMNALDDVHDKYGKFENAPKDKLSELIMSIPEDSEERHYFLDDMIDYFDFSSILSSKQIKSERMNFVNKDGKRFKGWWNGHTVEVDEVPSNNTDVECMEHYTLEELKRMGYEDEKLYNYNATREFNCSKAAQLMKSSKQIISSNDAKKLFEDEDIKDLIYEWSMYGEKKAIKNLLNEIDFDNPDTEKFIKFFKAVKKYSTDDELPIIEKALKLLGSSKQIKSSKLSAYQILYNGIDDDWYNDEIERRVRATDKRFNKSEAKELLEDLAGDEFAELTKENINELVELIGIKAKNLHWLRNSKQIKSSVDELSNNDITEGMRVTWGGDEKGKVITWNDNDVLIENLGGMKDFIIGHNYKLTGDAKEPKLGWGHGDYGYKDKDEALKAFKKIKSSKVIKSDRLPNEPTEKDYKIFVDLLNDYCEKHYGDYSGLYSFEYQPDEKYGSFIIVDNEGNLNIHSDDELTKYIRSKLSEKGWYPEAVYSESDFCITTM